MKSQAQKKKKTKDNEELKETLCDIVNKLNDFSKTEEKLEELVNYCSGSSRNCSESIK